MLAFFFFGAARFFVATLFHLFLRAGTGLLASFAIANLSETTPGAALVAALPVNALAPLTALASIVLATLSKTAPAAAVVAVLAAAVQLRQRHQQTLWLL